MAWNVNILTLFPELFPGPLALSVVGRGLKDGHWSINTTNIRDFAIDKHGTIDDTPYGGGGGMVMRPDVIGLALESIKPSTGPIIYLSPRGNKFTQELAKTLIGHENLTIVCGRFEGLDERAIKCYDMMELSAGDYVLSSGDLAALIVLDVCARLIPGVLGNLASSHEESFSYGQGHLLEYPHYTKPRVWNGICVPDVLLSGHHEQIKKWRLAEAERKTMIMRPDLWSMYIGGHK